MGTRGEGTGPRKEEMLANSPRLTQILCWDKWILIVCCPSYAVRSRGVTSSIFAKVSRSLGLS